MSSNVCQIGWLTSKMKSFSCIISYLQSGSISYKVIYPMWTSSMLQLIVLIKLCTFIQRCTWWAFTCHCRTNWRIVDPWINCSWDKKKKKSQNSTKWGFHETFLAFMAQSNVEILWSNHFHSFHGMHYPMSLHSSDLMGSLETVQPLIGSSAYSLKS